MMFFLRRRAGRRPGFESGFTLMELLIVISIMLILMLIAIPNFSGMKMQANETSAIQSLRAIHQAEIQYRRRALPARCRPWAARQLRERPRRRRRRCCRATWRAARRAATRFRS